MRALVAFLLIASLTGCADDIDPTAPIDATVTITATGCRNTLGRGIGTIIAPGLVLTAAHTLAGADSITIDHDRRTFGADIAAFDPTMDLALLTVDDQTLAPVPLTANPPTTGTAPGTTGTAVVRRDDRLVTLPVTIARRVNITTEDIYGNGEVVRPGYEITADIEPGDSGALIVIDGAGVAVIWSRSRRTDERAWAIDPIRGGDTIRTQLDNGIDAAIDITRC